MRRRHAIEGGTIKISCPVLLLLVLAVHARRHSLHFATVHVLVLVLHWVVELVDVGTEIVLCVVGHGEANVVG